ncbi:alpha/beta fold hydrolase [Candidatus Woesearchaeota archaeon]|nr:alpha/beta fold hydrolase [Candidatus Woesearchaeota archaeon]
MVIAKRTIMNRDGRRIAVVIERSTPQNGLAFVMHGLGGFKEQPHVRAFCESFLESGFTVVSFDACCTLGESGGRYEDATITNYHADLEDVIAWAKGQRWYQEPFWLCGHSLGGISVILYAEEHPEKVAALAPISTVVSGKLSLEHHTKEGLEEWERTGWLEKPSTSKPGIMKRLPWSHLQDRLLYDILPEAGRLTMPVLLIVGEKDESTPPRHQRLLYDALPGKRELHIIKGAPHTFREPRHIAEVKKIFKDWIARTA